MNTNIIAIRTYDPVDKPRLLDIWHRASLKAHGFLPHDLLAAQKQMVGEVYLEKAETFVATSDDLPVGFIGLLGSHIGGLFVDPDCQGSGIGRLLVAHAMGLKGALDLEVYARNEGGRGFYGRLGFVETGRRPTDDNGLPFELIALRLWAEQAQESEGGSPPSPQHAPAAPLGPVF
jgi:ribosomal protein S18 acetylase RimI-like enzyme